MLRKQHKSQSQTIAEVIKHRWCTGCTTCVGMCPTQALSVIETTDGRYEPAIDEAKCIHCGMCIRVCPPANENFQSLNRFLFDRIPEKVTDKLMGCHLQCYTGYAADAQLRYKATSGGLITALLLFLLETGKIDGAAVTRLSKDDPLKPEPFIARTREEILSAVGSKYIPVPLNQVLSQILAENGRFAYVGLPCHLHGLRRAQMQNHKLKDKIVYCFGLVCSRTMARQGWELVLKKMGFTTDRIDELKFRGEGWPGGMIVYDKDGNRHFMPMLLTWWAEIFGGGYFSHFYCMMCNDVWADFADIGFADAYIRSIMQADTQGTSIMIARTAQGQDLIDEIQLKGIAKLEYVSSQTALKTQLFMTVFKKRNILARIRMLKLFGQKIQPALKNREAFITPTFWDYFLVPIPFINIFISKNRFIRTIWRLLPLKLLMFYRKVFKWVLVRQTRSYVKE